MAHILMILILFVFAFESWNVSKTTESGADELVLERINWFHTPSMTKQHSAKLLSELQKVKSVTTVCPSVGRMEAPSSHGTSGARSLLFHEHNVELEVEPSAPPSTSGWTFEGILASDGSISTAKLMMEGRVHLQEYDPVKHARTLPGKHRKNSKVGNQQEDSSRPKKYSPCAGELRDLIPCLDATDGHLHGRCPNVNGGPGGCVIPAPKFYARQFMWPASKNQVRGPNVPSVPFLQHGRQASWMRPQGSSSTIYLGDDDARFLNGTSEYISSLAMMIQDQKFGTDVRLVLDIGCGSGNVAAALEFEGVLTLSIAGAGSPDNGVQVVMERGYPALVQSLGTLRLPYPSQAFDLIHCAACDVQWKEKGGLKLLEVDRLLRAGGFFVWMDESELGANWNGMEELTKSMCWRNLGRFGGTFSLWQKPTNQTCYLMRALPIPPLCNSSVSPDTSWNVVLQSCLVGFPATGRATTHPWPLRIKALPGRLEQTPSAGIEAAKPEAYTADLNYWIYILAVYVLDFGPVRVREIHNVLDMNAGYGGFAAAVSMRTPPLQWWVLNVVPIELSDRLAVIFDRGLLGVYHDWCESLDIYPRTFDMIHSSGFFSPSMRCNITDIVREMDRLLRPGGFALIRDQEVVLLKIQAIARAMHWKATVLDTESGPKGKDKLLNCQKTFWQPSHKGKNSGG